jgi:agmatinase
MSFILVFPLFLGTELHKNNNIYNDLSNFCKMRLFLYNDKMIDTIINTENLEEADVVIIAAPYEKTASSRKGTINGPKEIIKSLDVKLEFWDRKFTCEPNKFIKTGLKELDTISEFTPEEAVEQIKTTCKQVFNKDKFPFLLGGEHSVSIGMFQALAEKIDPKEVTILQIDAHCDLRNDNSDYANDAVSNLAHSCVMRRASELGFNLVQVGIRTYSINEHAYFSDPKNNVTVFEWGNGRKVPEISEILNAIKTKYLYISIDVDGFDPAHMPGTGTPVQGGLKWWYGVELIERAIESKELVGSDIVEVSPMQESVVTEYGAAQLLYTIISHKFRNKFK